jgi:glutathione S-transferase
VAPVFRPLCVLRRSTRQAGRHTRLKACFLHGAARPGPHTPIARMSRKPQKAVHHFVQARNMLKLMGSLTSPYVRKVRVVMFEKKLDCQLLEEDVWGSDSILKSNPLGKVPCLVMEGGEAVFDSRVIVEYLDTLSPVGKLIPPAGRERIEVRTWEALADGLMDAAILARLEATWAGRTPEQRCQGWIDRQVSRMHSALAAMSQGLADKPYCAGNHFTLADVATGCALGYADFRFGHINWRQAHPNLHRLHDKLAARQSFIDSAAP